MTTNEERLKVSGTKCTLITSLIVSNVCFSSSLHVYLNATSVQVECKRFDMTITGYSNEMLHYIKIFIDKNEKNIVLLIRLEDWLELLLI